MVMTLSRSYSVSDHLRLQAKAEIERRVRVRQRGICEEADAVVLEIDWRTWLTTLFPAYVQFGFAEYHVDFWSWVWALERGVSPQPFVAIWSRAGAKSTSAELACVAIGARKQRRYVLYVSETQEQADDHVQNIGGMIEAATVDRYYPDLASRLVGKYGNSRGWRRNRLRTQSGFTIDAIGLDSAARGAKLDEDRPDLICLDDLDSELDTPVTVDKKILTLTRKLIPAGAADLAILAIQNLVHPDSIFSRLADGRAEFLADRIVSGPHPALRNLAYEQKDGRCVLISGEPTWEGMSLDRCQKMVDDMGISAFRSECQHEVEAPPGGMFDHIEFQHCEWEQVPTLDRIVVWVDPAVTSTDESDAHGIQADGISSKGTIYRLWSWEDRTSPEDVLRRAITKAVELKAECVGVETDQGGDTWQTIYNELVKKMGIKQPPAFRSEKAGAGHGPKAHRASQMLADYERGKFVHVLGTHAVLERALRRFPKTKPYDLVDSAFWSWHDLTHGTARIRWL